MKAGTRLKSTVCDTEVMVIKAAREAVIACGGAPMVEVRNGAPGAIDPVFAEGAKIGKRYEDAESAIELLCVKAGLGSLSADGVALVAKEAKPLPSSD